MATLTDHYDAIVIGAGQGGDPLARALAGAGRRTALIEREAVGGTCVNYGCTPTKTMVHIAKVAETVRRAADYGVRSSAPRIDMLKVRALKRGIVDEFRTGTEKGISKVKGLDLIYGHASFVDAGTVLIKLREGGVRTVTAETIVINVGTRPFIPPIEGLSQAPYLDNRTIMELDHVPETLIVLGGDYIGLEFGQMFSRLGSKVTVLEHSARFLPREDADVADEILKILREDGLEIRLGVGVKRVSGHVSLDLDSGDTVDGSELLVAVGRRPNTDDLGAAGAGIELDERGFIKADSHLRTTASGVYVLGDVKGGPAFTHISYDDQRVLRANLIDGEDRTIDGRYVPNCTFIDPQLGRIGLSETEAKAQGIDYRLCKMPMSNVARAVEMNESRGFIKVLVSKQTDQILGAAVLGVEGGEIMSMIELAMLGGLTAKQLNNAIFAHPTLSELLNNLFG
jgi:pyruvate/2-oxoglutarate dehydrogenase complex dihydrolipoamide dehydrogenase (E3) component